MASQEYTEEQLNFFRMCYIVTIEMATGLRHLFKQEWDRIYGTSHGQWNDTAKNGQDFWNGESPKNRQRNDAFLKKIMNENREKWDCTVLFYAILFSDCMAGLKGTVISNSVDDLRKVRNSTFAHNSQGQLSIPEFNAAVGNVLHKFKNLGLPSMGIQEISKQTSFPTKELSDVLDEFKKLREDWLSLKEEYNALEKNHKGLKVNHEDLKEEHEGLKEKHEDLKEWLQGDAPSFCIPPPKPSHEIAPRHNEVMEQLKKMKNASENVGLSYFYISGNPGSGKSELARQIAEKFYHEPPQDANSPRFVMTLNADTKETLFESYISLARKVKCLPDDVNMIYHSNVMTTEEKINNVKDFIATKIKHYTSWLVVVDNVIQDVCPNYLPGSDNQWGTGLLLITTQDPSTVPLECPFISHLCIKRGLEPNDASSLLVNVSGIDDQEMDQAKVAEALDYQPLALASAGTYCKLMIEKVNPNFGWKDFLEKLKEGKLASTEMCLTMKNPCYPKSMTTATKMAVDMVRKSDSIMNLAFTFLSVCARDELRLKVLTKFIQGQENDTDEDKINLVIAESSLLIFEEKEKGVFINLHQVVHGAIVSVVEDTMTVDERREVVHKACGTFAGFLDETFPNEQWNTRDTTAESRDLIPHLKTLGFVTKDIFSTKEEIEVFTRRMSNSDVEYFYVLNTLAIFVSIHDELRSAMNYRSLEFKSGWIYTQKGLSHSLRVIGESLCFFGNLTAGQKIFEEALSLKNEQKPDSISTAHVLHDLGLVHTELNDLEQAKKCFEDALLLYCEPADIDPHAADTYNTLGFVFTELGELERAKTCHENALDIQREHRSPGHVDFAVTYEFLANFYWKMGDLQAAKKYFEDALVIEEQKLGRNHGDVTSTKQALLRVNKELGDQQ